MPPLQRKKPENIPTHVAVIMDGNGRWAVGRGLSRTEGHRMGVQSLRQLVETAGELGIKYLTVYAFSTENWGRPQEEVEALLNLLQESLNEYLPELVENNVRVRVIGRRDDLDSSLRECLERAERETAHYVALFLNIAFNYGGRAELVDGICAIVQRALTGEISPGEIDEELIEEHLYLRGQPAPDLLIRTGGEHRVSNFLLWHIAYTEFYVTPVPWPEFGPRDLYRAIESYSRRQRRFGQL